MTIAAPSLRTRRKRLTFTITQDGEDELRAGVRAPEHLRQRVEVARRVRLERDDEGLASAALRAQQRSRRGTPRQAPGSVRA